MTIKLSKHITVAEMTNWRKKGITFECHGYSFFAITDNATLEAIINKANRIIK